MEIMQGPRSPESVEKLRRHVLGRIDVVPVPKSQWAKRFKVLLRSAECVDPNSNEIRYRRSVLETPYANAIVVGGWMENVNGEIHELTDELSQSTAVLQKLVNEVKSLTNAIEPELLESIKRTRANRMALVSELRTSLDQLREVRSFFLDSTYEKEMERLERFTKLCREILELKAAGVFDAVCDSAIRLAVKEESQR